MRAFDLLAALALAIASACSAVDPPTGSDPPPDVSRPVPLSDLGAGTYLGFEGGLYPGGSNVPPADHDQRGEVARDAIRPFDASGRPDPAGRVVLLSVGMSNTTQEFCGGGNAGSCNPWTFAGQAAADPRVDHATLAIVDGAQGGEDAAAWTDPGDPTFDVVDRRLETRGLAPAQVQAAWIKQADARPAVSLPDPDADARVLERHLGDIVRALRMRYPNLRLVFLSNRTYGGYATTELNPEPFAYESGFAVKWLIDAQIEQARTGRIDPVAGDLGPAAAPWLGWGPDLWADGATPRSDGLVWLRGDFVGDGTHPSTSGETKVAGLLLEFFATSPYARGWFRAG